MMLVIKEKFCYIKGYMVAKKNGHMFKDHVQCTWLSGYYDVINSNQFRWIGVAINICINSDDVVNSNQLNCNI